MRLTSADISESQIRQTMPDILDILLICRSTSTQNKIHNIIWANHNYAELGNGFAATDQILPKNITGKFGDLIMPRALKTAELQKARTKAKAEVFTPSHIVKLQNDALDENYRKDKLARYLSRKWLEITCGEAPYMANRYEMATGEMIPINERSGFVDRKLKRINQEIHNKKKWQNLVKKAYQASYGFEWNGDSLLLARENLLLTYHDYHIDKWNIEPEYLHLKQIAEIISYNIFQMDGLTNCIPLSNIQELIINYQHDLFDDVKPKIFIAQQGQRVKIKDWKTRKMVFFDAELSNEQN